MSSIPNSAMPHAIAEPEPDAAPAANPAEDEGKPANVFSRAVRMATTPAFITLGAGLMVYDYVSKRVGAARAKKAY